MACPPSLRAARRDEIDADLWEQANETPAHLASSLTSQLLARWFLGLPDDLLWRVAHIRAKDVNPKEGAMIQSQSFKPITVLAAIISAVSLAWLVINTVLGEISYQRQSDVAFYVHAETMLFLYGPPGLAAIVGGFVFMRKAPMLCALLVTAGSMALGILVFWLVIPIFIAAGLSVYAFRRARRIEVGD